MKSLDLEEYKDYELDVKNTLLSNLVYILFIGLCTVFIIKAFAFINNLQSEDIKLLGLIVFLFAFIKITYNLHSPNLEYKLRVK